MGELVGVILAAGRGRRMGELGNHHVKALLPVGDRPLIRHHLRLLRELGVGTTHVVVGHHGDAVERTLLGDDDPDMTLRLVRQDRPLGSAHALARLLPVLDSPFILLLGDYYFVPERPERLLRHLERGESAIAVKPETDLARVRAACAVDTDGDGRVVGITEKPVRPRTRLKGCGFYALQPDVLDAVTRTPRTALRDEYELTVALELLVRSGHPLYAREVVGRDYNITGPEDLLQCNLDWLEERRTNRFVAERAQVDEGTRLQRVVVGEDAVVRGDTRLDEVVVFPGARLADAGAVRRALVTPEGSIPCGGPARATGQGGPV